MSCRAMGMFGAPVVAAIAVVTIAYGCGPNIVVGAIGATVTGVLAVKDKVNKVYWENRLAENPTEAERQVLHNRISVLEKSQNAHMKLCKLFAISMIPIAGPVIAMIKQ